jgi:hypothetical protein
MLEPVSYDTQEVNAVPMTKCEICGTKVPTSQAFSIKLSYAVPGEGKNPYECPAVQHWACSHEHAEEAVMACLCEHIRKGDHA